LVELALTGRVVVVVLEEGKQLETAKATSSIAVNSLEGGMGSEISNLAEALAEAFKLAFTVTNSHEQVLESVL